MADHAWSFDQYHQAHRCTECGLVSYAVALPAGPCRCAPSTWLPSNAPDGSAPGFAHDLGTPKGRYGRFMDLRASGLSVDEAAAQVFREESLDLFDSTLRRMGEEMRAAPVTDDDLAMLERVKAAVFAEQARERGEP